jgi:hypothetical protein
MHPGVDVQANEDQFKKSGDVGARNPLHQSRRGQARNRSCNRNPHPEIVKLVDTFVVKAYEID